MANLISQRSDSMLSFSLRQRRRCIAIDTLETTSAIDRQWLTTSAAGTRPIERVHGCDGQRKTTVDGVSHTYATCCRKESYDRGGV